MDCRRRIFHVLVPALLVLAACSAGAAVDEPLTQEQFSACVQDLAQQTDRAAKPLSREDFERIASNAHYDDRVRQALLVQAGEPTYWWDELAATTDAERVAQGRQILAQNAAVLQQIQDRFGVPKEIVVAIYGIETNYGPAQGRIPVLDATLTLACLHPCDASRASCASRERAYAAVRLLRDQRVPPANDWLGSWAGAFGSTQFEPDTFEQLGVDFTGKGAADLINSPVDAWASTANHLAQRGGWTMGVPVYIEVSVPPDQQAAFASGGQSVRLRDQAKPLSQWVAQGWKALAPAGASPEPVAGDPEVYPFLPVGLPGPAFLVSHNFDTLMRYNSSERYAMEVALLAHKIAGGGDFVTPWPTDDPGLTRAQVRELQAWLVMRGHTQVVPDGVMGPNTRDAIEQEFVAKGLPPARRVGQRTLKLLMQP